MSSEPDPQILMKDLAKSIKKKFEKGDPEARDRMTVDVNQKTHSRFKDIARKLNTDMSSLLRVIIQDFTDGYEALEDTEDSD